jgi:hypothetical protein
MRKVTGNENNRSAAIVLSLGITKDIVLSSLVQKMVVGNG